MADQQISMFSDQAAPSVGKPASFSLSKTINAGAQRVFDQWLIPVFLEGWLFVDPTGKERVVDLQNTVRKGGDFNYRVSRNGQEVCYTGDYEELSIPNRLTFTWSELGSGLEPLQINVQFTADGDKTRLKLQGRIPAEQAENLEHIKGQWAVRLAALAERCKRQA